MESDVTGKAYLLSRASYRIITPLPTHFRELNQLDVRLRLKESLLSSRVYAWDEEARREVDKKSKTEKLARDIPWSSEKTERVARLGALTMR